MPCYHPWSAYQRADGSISSVERKGDFVRTLTLPCGQCVGCRLERSRQWAIRCLHEAQLHEFNCFITLTYAGEVPQEGLRYSDFQKFMKRLRKRWSKDKIRFYMCGEYGDVKGRPHFHACLFGFDFPDKVVYSKRKDVILYTSRELDAIWGKGLCVIGDVTFESAAYVARYIMKKVTGNIADEYYNGLVPEFNKMSLKPGIGSGWFEKFSSDVYPDGQVVVRGFKSKPPRYYDKLYKKIDIDGMEMLEFKRHLEGLIRLEDQTDDRLIVRETVAKARLDLLKRNLGE